MKKYNRYNTLSPWVFNKPPEKKGYFLNLNFYRYFSESNSIDVPSNSRVGTKRYLAPEVLDSSILDEDFESYKQVAEFSNQLFIWTNFRFKILEITLELL